MKTAQEITKAIYECSQGEIVEAMIQSAQLDAFKAGAEWAAKMHHSQWPNAKDGRCEMCSALDALSATGKVGGI